MTTEKLKNPLRIVFNATVAIFIILFTTYTVIKLTLVENNSYDPYSKALNEVSNTIEIVSTQGWAFIRPFLQLCIILLVVEWTFNKIGISFSGESKMEWNIQTVIALIIVGAFTLAALSGIAGVSYLEDIALVVIGFYFGSREKKPLHTTRTDGSVPPSDTPTI